MKIKIIIVGSLQTNCYLLIKNGRYLIIDPGDEADKIISNIDGDVLAILITHNHYDHIGALKELQKYYDCPVYDYYSLHEEKMIIDCFTFLTIKTPGHTKDSLSFLFNNDLFCGDFIFKGSVGRTDLGGNDFDMRQSINKIKKYPHSLKIFPGHGDMTTLKNELVNNYYLSTNFGL